MMQRDRRLSVVLGLSAAMTASAMAQQALVNSTSPTALYLRAGTIDTSQPAGDIARAIANAPAQTRFVLQLDGPITPDRRARMVAAGIKIGDYLPTNAYIVDLARADARAVAGLEFVRWFGEYQNEWKLDPDLMNRVYTSPERLATLAAGKYPVNISIFSGFNVGGTQQQILSIPGATITGSQQLGGNVELMAEVPQFALQQLATIPGVQYVEPLPEVKERNDTTRWIVQSNVQSQYPVYDAGLQGEGQIVGILDSGFDINHCSFKDSPNTPGPNHRKVVYNTGSPSFHGTHVAGTAVGEDPANGAHKTGIAHKAKMAYSNWPSFNEAAMVAALTDHFNVGARIHTNSWGDDGTTAYNSLCRGIDIFQYNNEDSIIMFASTNQSQLKNPENAKNLIAVGNCNDAPNQGTFSTGGTGPTSDGRRKPEIWAPGTDTNSASSGTACNTATATGTSMASPAIAGTCALIRQYFVEGYQGGGIANPAAGFVPSGALIKATLLNSGVDMSGGTGYPGVREGWGRVLLDNSLFFAGDTRKLQVTDIRNNQGLSTSNVTDSIYQVLGSDEDLRVTLVWTEPPAAAGAAIATVNDLDLEVVSPTGQIYLGNVFSAAGYSQTGGTKDEKNNVEQVHIDNPATGNWTVRVKGANVAVGTQGYALVVTGDVPPPQPAPLYMSLITTVPQLLAPGTSLDLDVNIVDGAETYVPGSGKMFYRMTNAGGFTELALAPQGGTVHRATLPAASCGDTPQLYFTAQGSLGTVVSVPFGAPANLLSTSIGTITVNTVYEQNFNSGIPSGWTTSGLWSVNNNCAPSGTCGSPNWAYYGQSNCDYNTGTTNSGLLTAAAIVLPTVAPGGKITMTYCSAKESENLASYDKSQVLVNNTVVDEAGDSLSWETRSVDLTAYAGQSITLAFKFDTIDSIANDYRGWHVDNIKITAEEQNCSGPAACYANCDGSTSSPILNVSDFGCFLSKFAAGDPYANCDGSTGSPQLNVADFGCFLTKFAAGCN